MTKDKFKTYIAIQKCGAVNMFDIKAVIELSDNILSKKDILNIMENYDKYVKEFNLDNNK